MRYKGIKGAAPRNPRTIAERVGMAPANIPDAPEYDAVQGVPQGTPGAGQAYKDAAAEARPSRGKKGK